MSAGPGQHNRGIRSPGPFMSATHRRGPDGMDGPAGTGRWLATLGRHTWYLAMMAVAAFGLVAGSVTVLVQANGTPSQLPAASNCGLVNCGAALPGPSATISTQSHIGKAHTTVSHAPKPSASPAPPPSQAPTQAQAQPPNVTLTFSADQDRRDFDHFQGQLTLVNQGGSPVAGWTAELTLPGDEVFSVENQDGRDGFPFDHWQFDGDTLTISADNGSETLTPGQPLSLSIHGRGQTPLPHRVHLQRRRLPHLKSHPAEPPAPAAPAAPAPGPAARPESAVRAVCAVLAITALAVRSVFAADRALLAAVSAALPPGPALAGPALGPASAGPAVPARRPAAFPMGLDVLRLAVASSPAALAPAGPRPNWSAVRLGRAGDPPRGLVPSAGSGLHGGSGGVTGRRRLPPAQPVAAIPDLPPRDKILSIAAPKLPSSWIMRCTTMIRAGMAQKSPHTHRIAAPIC